MRTDITPLETRYAGCHFRSRLEARWAVFFDELGIEWQYEPQGFEGHGGAKYLPDFYLPWVTLWPWRPNGMGVYVEVKGSDEMLSHDGDRIASCIEYQSTPVSEGLLILGDIPRVKAEHSAVTHSVCYWHKGVAVGQVQFECWDPDGLRWILGKPSAHPTHMFEGSATETLPYECTTVAKAWHTVAFDAGNRPHKITELGFGRGRHVLSAYTAARSARFEHGQSGIR